MTDEQFQELLGRMDGLEDEVLGRLETLSKRLERYVAELTSHHKMVRTRLDGLDEAVERVEKGLEVIEQKLDEWEEDDGKGDLVVQPSAAEGKGKGKVEEADDGESGDESEERTEDE